MNARTTTVDEVEVGELDEVEQAEPVEATYAEIAARAYEIYRSGEGGDDVANWLQAEHELTSSPSRVSMHA